jgi:protein SCO1
MNRPSGSTRHVSATLIIFAAVAAACGLWLGSRIVRAPAQAPLQNAAVYPVPRAVPEFHLTQTNGKPLSLADWRGHWNLVYFGYTSCPDACPTTLAVFKQVWKDLAQRGIADRVRFDFISVDPGRDTPERLASYVGFFNPDFIAATGSDDELNPLTRSLGILYRRGTDASGAIEVDHSDSVVIIDPEARMIGMFRPPFTAAPLAADIATFVAGKD